MTLKPLKKPISSKTHFKWVKTWEKLSCVPIFFFGGLKVKISRKFIKYKLKTGLFYTFCYVFSAIESKPKQLEHFENRFGILTASLKSGRKVENLEEFRNFNSLEFGELIVPLKSRGDFRY